MAPPARKAWSAAYARLSEGYPGLFGAVTGRAEAQCLRLALAYALMRGASEIHISVSKRSDETQGLTIDGETRVPDPTPRRIDLLRDVRLALAYLYRQIDEGKIQSQDGTRRA